jgi:hypothetical protein
MATFRAHFEEELRRYGRETIVSLIDRKGIEADLADAFEEHV